MSKKRGATSVRCPRCGAPSRVLRTSLGERQKRSSRSFVRRERRCTGEPTHRFLTDERHKR